MKYLCFQMMRRLGWRLEPRRKTSAALEFEENYGEGRQAKIHRVRQTGPRCRFGLDAAEVADVAAAVCFGVSVEDFVVAAGLGDADAIIFADDRREIRHDDDDVARVARPADEAEDAVLGVGAIEPLKTLPFKIDFMQSRLAANQIVQIGDEALRALMVGRKIQEIPVQARVVIPFFALAEFSA